MQIVHLICFLVFWLSVGKCLIIRHFALYLIEFFKVIVSGQPPYKFCHFQAESQKLSYNFQKIKVFKTNFGHVLKLIVFWQGVLKNLHFQAKSWGCLIIFEN